MVAWSSMVLSGITTETVPAAPVRCIGRLCIGRMAEHVEQELSARPVQGLCERLRRLAPAARLFAERNHALGVEPDDGTVATRCPRPGVEAHWTPAVAPWRERDVTRLDQRTPCGQQLSQRRERTVRRRVR